jgi:hypothetical protein
VLLDYPVFVIIGSSNARVGEIYVLTTTTVGL